MPLSHLWETQVWKGNIFTIGGRKMVLLYFVPTRQRVCNRIMFGGWLQNSDVRRVCTWTARPIHACNPRASSCVLRHANNLNPWLTISPANVFWSPKPNQFCRIVKYTGEKKNPQDNPQVLTRAKILHHKILLNSAQNFAKISVLIINFNIIK